MDKIMENSFDIDNPIFVMGTGRCGLSPMMDLISYHPAFAWPSQFNNKFPKSTYLSYLSRLVEVPLMDNPRIRNRYFPPRHSEAFHFYNQQFYGFAQPFRDLTKDDVSPYVKGKFRKAVSEIMRYQGKSRFIAEYSGWSRIGFLKEIFPGAKFIHVVRDGRAVANSLTNVQWWLGWEGVYKWRWGIPEYETMKKLADYNHSFLAYAGIHWKILIRRIIEQSENLASGDLLVIRYEDMVQNPHREASRCINFCNLDDNNPRFIKQLSKVKIVNANEKQFRIPAWQGNMNQQQLDMLNDLLEDELAYFNYIEKDSIQARQDEQLTNIEELVRS